MRRHQAGRDTAPAGGGIATRRTRATAGIRPAPLGAPATGSLTDDGFRRPEPCGATTRKGTGAKGQRTPGARNEKRGPAAGKERRDGAPDGARRLPQGACGHSERPMRLPALRLPSPAPALAGAARTDPRPRREDDGRTRRRHNNTGDAACPARVRRRPPRDAGAMADNKARYRPRSCSLPRPRA